MTVEDGKLMADAATGEFWGIFGGFAPLPRKVYNSQAKSAGVVPTKLLWYVYFPFTFFFCSFSCASTFHNAH